MEKQGQLATLVLMESMEELEIQERQERPETLDLPITVRRQESVIRDLKDFRENKEILEQQELQANKSYST